MDRYPTTEEGLNVLITAPAGDESKWRGPYVKMLRADPWGNPYQYVLPGTHHPTSFDLWSRGAEILSGLAPGEQVIVDELETFHPGDRVRVNEMPSDVAK